MIMSIGRVFKRPGSQNWHIEFSCNGQKVRFSSKTTSKTKAKQILVHHVNDMLNGTLPRQLRRHLPFKKLSELLINNYEINGKKSIDRAQRSVKKLAEFFATKNSGNIKAKDIWDYIDYRKDQGVENSTINRELSALKRMFNLAKLQKRIQPEDMPEFPPQLDENNIREGFIKIEDLERLLKQLPTYLQPVVEFAFYTGMRKSEIASIEWNQVDLKEGFVHLRAGQAKNKTARSVPLLPEIIALLKDLKKKAKKGQELVFTNTRNKPIGDFYSTWRKHVAKAGFEGLIFHDLRRSAVKVLVDAGVPEKVCMEITGHKSRQIFDRYHINNHDDLRKAAAALSAFAKKKKEEAMDD